MGCNPKMGHKGYFDGLQGHNRPNIFNLFYYSIKIVGCKILKYLKQGYKKKFENCWARGIGKKKEISDKSRETEEQGEIWKGK